MFVESEVLVMNCKRVRELGGVVRVRTAGVPR